MIAADFARYVRANVIVLRETATGIIGFNCPWCSDKRGRGWVSLERQTAGCWNDGCPASPRFKYGALEWVQLMEGFDTIGETRAFMLDRYPGGYFGTRKKQHEPGKIELPECVPLSKGPTTLHATKFIRKTWGLTLKTANRWGLRLCLENGLFFQRLLIPIKFGGELVGYLGRRINNVGWKYRASTGAPLADILYGIDNVKPGKTVIVLEGTTDVMRWMQDYATTAVALFGQEVTNEKIALLLSRDPKRVIVALDNDATQKGLAIADTIAKWGVPTGIGTWVGGKDAGAGARLKFHPLDSLEMRIKLGRTS